MTTFNAAALVALPILGGVLVAWMNAHSSRRNADQQLKRDLMKQRQTLMHESLTKAYVGLDAWIATVCDQADDLCFGDDLAALPPDRRTGYDICVALHQGPLRLPKEGQFLWGSKVTGLVHELRDQAVKMATAVIELGQSFPQDHGHDQLDVIAERLRFAMREELFQPSANTSSK